MKKLFIFALAVLGMTCVWAWEPEDKPQRITVASTGAMPPRGEGGTAEEDVQRILEFWRGEFSRMLVDKPDLILVPGRSGETFSSSVGPIR